jgi:hypothetical protein
MATKTDACLMPELGLGADNELRFRVDEAAPGSAPAVRGIYFDPSRGLWADPAPMAAAVAVSGPAKPMTVTVAPKATTTLAPGLSWEFRNDTGDAAVAAGLWQPRWTITTNTSAQGFVTVLGNTSALASGPASGAELATMHPQVGTWNGSAGVSFARSVAARGTGLVTTRLWVRNGTTASLTVTWWFERIVGWRATEGST